MKILSFDVGINNLAYCIINCDHLSVNYSVSDWGIIDLADDKKTCTIVNKKHNICGKVASSSLQHCNTNYYVCSAHKDHYQFEQVTFNTYINYFFNKNLYFFTNTKL